MSRAFSGKRLAALILVVGVGALSLMILRRGKSGTEDPRPSPPPPAGRSTPPPAESRGTPLAAGSPPGSEFSEGNPEHARRLRSMLEGHLKEFASEEELSQECARILDGSSPLFKQPEFSAFPGAKRQIQEWIFYKIREIRTDDPAPLRVLSEATASFVSRLVTADDMNSRLSSQAVSTLYHLTGRCASAQDQLARLLENNLDSRHLPSLVGCSPSVVSSTLSPRLQSVLWLVIDSQRPAEARSAAAGVLASHSGEDPELRARLIRGYWERDESSRSAIVEGLRNSYRPAQPILDFATQVLRTERSESARGHAIEILTGSREGVDRQTVTLVRASLTDPSSFVRMSAVMFFAHQGGREDVGPLESMAGSDSDAEVRRRAKEAVAVLRKKHP